MVGRSWTRCIRTTGRARCATPRGAAAGRAAPCDPSTMGGSGASATVVVQVGQCGNQLGGALLDELHAHDCGGEGAYFREGGRGASVARAVLLDTEPKVVRAALDRGGVGWRYDGGGAAVIGGGGGAGNNWASGFYEHGAAAAELACERVRREAEHADALGGMLLVHSVAGGTGSGAGCAAAAALRDAFPAVNMLSCAVWPFESGEVAVQSYNGECAPLRRAHHVARSRPCASCGTCA